MSDDISRQKLWLGIDVGTTAVKAAAYSADGVCRAFSDAPSQVAATRAGHSEQDMDGVCNSVFAAIRDVASQVDADMIQSVGIAAQGDGFWAIDAHGKPARNAVLWNDTRASTVLSALSQKDSAKIARACHTSIWPGTSGAIYSWLKQFAPEDTGRVEKVMHCAGWIGFNLTGKAAVDFSDASIPFLDIKTRVYSSAAIRALRAEDLQHKLLAPQSAETLLGSVTNEAAAHTGLRVGTAVSVGTLDLSAMIVGMGMDQPGDTMMILGTTAVVNILTNNITPSDHPVGATVLHANGKIFTRVLAPTTGAAAFDWFCGLHPQTLGGETSAEIAGKLNALARNVPPGANGVTFLPHLNGERAPFVAPEASGAFFGLRAVNTKADMGRAVMEGTAFSLRHCYIAERGHLPKMPIRLTGGGSKNALWCQIIADIMQTPIEVTAASDHGLWGAACLGAAARSQSSACTLARRHERTTTYSPNRENAALYDAAFETYLTLSQACQALWVQ
ncbi:FGGY-family carbohydrate kinase [Cognatishimia sp. WU-CL00825]|uniref:FGGY-family carbohydrate kinase n=1 Tax=Cognatishimia sp. WU-CL00825 TaxID=3127658 RepID=UPI00310BF20D